MRHLLLLLILANILYFMWELYAPEETDVGVAVVREADLGPPLEISDASVAQAAASVGAVLGSGKPTDLSAVVGRSCVSIGPFKNSSDAEAAISDFEKQEMRASLRTTEAEIFVGHWVQIQDIPNRESANEMLATLQSGGLGDAYMVPDDGEGLKISLGLFSEANRAERIELQAKSLDLPASITARTRIGAVYYVDIGLPPGRGAGAMIEQYGENNVLLRNAATCPKIGG